MIDILIVEDNKELSTLLEDFLKFKNYIVTTTESGEKALEYFERYGAKLIILDVMLLGMNGFEVCSKIRETSNVPILIVSAKNEKDDQINGLKLGADDYIEKPYDIDILLAKIDGIFKRNYAQEKWIDGNIELDCVNSICYVDGLKIEMTLKEFNLLLLLMKNKNKTLKKEFLLHEIWGGNNESEPQTLTVHINYLRNKLGKENFERIETVWGVGYKFV